MEAYSPHDVGLHSAKNQKKKREKKTPQPRPEIHKIPLSSFLVPLQSGIYSVQQGVPSAPDSWPHSCASPGCLSWVKAPASPPPSLYTRRGKQKGLAECSTRSVLQGRSRLASGLQGILSYLRGLPGSMDSSLGNWNSW